MNILADASIAGIEHAFPSPFKLVLFNDESSISKLLQNTEILICRSTLQVNRALLTNHSLRYVATASSGTDHIDSALLKEQGIQLIDAKGCNAISVADYVLSCIAHLQLNHRFSAATAGIIGCGAVGSEVKRRLEKLGFTVRCYDPLKARPFRSSTLEESLLCDIICIHPNLHSSRPCPSYNLLDQHELDIISASSVMINASRGGVVNEKALITRPHFLYCTDVYENEPDINPRIIERATICTPHIAGHSINAKQSALFLISNKLHQAYNLPTPSFDFSCSKTLPIESYSTWQELVLKLYDPSKETLVLKQAYDKKNAFLVARKRHLPRYNFSSYSLPENNSLISKFIY